MKTLKIPAMAATAVGSGVIAYEPKADLSDLPNRIPEAAPYVTSEAQAFGPPFEDYWRTQDHPGQCKSCHAKIFDEWNGSMMSNAWRDPVWRAALLLLARTVSTHGDCDAPSTPDGTKRAATNPFAKPGACASVFDIGTGKYTVSRPGSLLDAFCSRCHMPTNYIDNVPLRNVTLDPETGIESAKADPGFNPTSDNGTGSAFATVDAQFRNTDSGKAGIFCAVCHSLVATRDTPFHNYARSGAEYVAAPGEAARHDLLGDRQDVFAVADPAKRNLGYGIGSGSYRLSAHAIGAPERFGPLAAGTPPDPIDRNTSSVFGVDVPYQHMDASKHAGFHDAMFVRAEMCGSCHDVTNALPIKNQLGQWVGGFPIERTYTEWANSRYSDRPGNTKFDPRFKRDCQSCHMQQDYGQPGTAQTLYAHGLRLPPPVEPVATGSAPHPFFTHHFVGGNALVPRLIGKGLDAAGASSPYPELANVSFSSGDRSSPYSRAVWTHVERQGRLRPAGAAGLGAAAPRAQHGCRHAGDGALGRHRPADDHDRQHGERARLSHGLTRGPHRVAGGPRLRSRDRPRALDRRLGMAPDVDRRGEPHGADRARSPATRGATGVCRPAPPIRMRSSSRPWPRSATGAPRWSCLTRAPSTSRRTPTGCRSTRPAG